MSSEVKSPEEMKNPKVDPNSESELAKQSQKIVDNHKKAAMHHEAAAKHHHEAAKQQMGGNTTMATGLNIKAKNETDLARKAQKKNHKKQAKAI
jgi:hypothetical protein